MIFENIFWERDHETLPIYHAHSPNSKRLAIGRSISSRDFLSVMLVNHQFYQEASPLFFRWNHPYFELCDVKQIKDFLYSLPHSQTSMIRELSFAATAFRIQNRCTEDWTSIINLLERNFKLSRLIVDLPVDPDWAIAQVTKHSPVSEHDEIIQAYSAMINCANNAFNRYSWRGARRLMALLVQGFVTSTVTFRYPLPPSIGSIEVNDLANIRQKLFAPFHDHEPQVADEASPLTESTFDKDVVREPLEARNVVDHLDFGSRCLRSHTEDGCTRVFMAYKSDLAPFKIDKKLLYERAMVELGANWFILSMLGTTGETASVYTGELFEDLVDTMKIMENVK
jgi:hypothetical protein